MAVGAGGGGKAEHLTLNRTLAQQLPSPAGSVLLCKKAAIT